MGIRRVAVGGLACVQGAMESEVVASRRRLWTP